MKKMKIIQAPFETKFAPTVVSNGGWTIPPTSML
jgi:hypothetical protein